jgi:ribonuclease D
LPATDPLIRDSSALASLCERLRAEPYVTVDTEFMTERTYYPRLCLVQLAGDTEAAAVDTLERDLDLSPLAALLSDPEVLKVMHAGRQDLQILRRECGVLAEPFFDTQVAAAFCGFGEQPGYDRLVTELLDLEIDKSAQATDWSRRPLAQRQIDYALSDVIHLRPVYEQLLARLRDAGREGWVVEEMDALLDSARHEPSPEQAWRRVKIKRPTRRALGILQELAAWREIEARERDLPRGWVVRDDALAEIALHPPRDRRQLARVRGMKEAAAHGAEGRAILAGIERALSRPEGEWPEPPKKRTGPTADESMVALLQALLRLRCDAAGVATRMVANRDDLECIALDPEADVPALHGWRREIFGEDARALRDGRLSLTGADGKVVVNEH